VVVFYKNGGGGVESQKILEKLEKRALISA